jgi:Na+/melibiose symporter-like transporter
MFMFSSSQSFGQQDEQRITNLESKVLRLENQIRQYGHEGVAFFLFGAFCALWAQNTGRNAWGWFFLGLFFNVITVIVLLYKNSNDLCKRKEQG